MILVTVGSQLRFDRLARAMDGWCERSCRSDVFGQLGDPGADGYRPQHFPWQPFLSLPELERLMDDADLIVAHAGMGSIISALTRAKPIMIMPRRAIFGETRNDHQQATAMRFSGRPLIYVASDETVLDATIDAALTAQRTTSLERLSAFADPGLINGLRRFILEGDGQ